MKIEDLKTEIQNITEPRRISHGNIRHKLEDIIIIGLCTIEPQYFAKIFFKACFSG